jgi:hypothetical protein
MAISSCDPEAKDRQIIDDLIDCLLTTRTRDSRGNSDRLRRPNIIVNALATKTSDTVILRFVVDLTQFVAYFRSSIDSSSEESTGGENLITDGQNQGH